MLSVRIYLLSVFSLLYVGLYGQATDNDTTIYIDADIVVTGSRLDNFAIGSTIQKIDSGTLERYSNQPISELLRAQTAANIRSYGPGGLASSSIRGGGSAHTLVLWNGLSIKSPMNGGTNLSSLTTGLYDKVDVQFGGSGTLYGSGAVTGIIHLSSNDILEANNNVKITGKAGSFDHYNLYTSWKTGNAKVASRVKIYGNTADNDFKFRNDSRFGTPVQRQTNAGWQQVGLLHDFALKTGDNGALNTSVWYQYNSKDLQTLMTNSDTSQANQTDYDLRMTANWIYKGNNHIIKVNNGFFNNKNIYRNPDGASGNSVNKYQKIINEIDNKWFPSPGTLINYGLTHTTEIAQTDNYRKNTSRNRYAIFLSYKKEDLFERLKFSVSAREELVENKFIPFTYSTDFDLNTIYNIHLIGSYSKNYRLPTLNDLYWDSGVYAQGNPDLLPENGHSLETGLEKHLKMGQVHLSLSNNFFYSTIENRIVWLPNEENVWMPHNKQKAISHGGESRVQVYGTLGKLDWSVKSSYTYTDSEMEEHTSEGVHKRPMRYVPKHKALVDVALGYRRFSLKYNHTYNSARFYDEVNKLEAYQLADLTLGYDELAKVKNLNVALSVKNIWNTNYQVMAWYAMPLRHYQLKVSYHLNY